MVETKENFDEESNTDETVFEYPRDLVGNSNVVIVFDEAEECPDTDAKTEFLAGEYYVDKGDMVTLHAERETYNISKSNIAEIVN